MHATVLDLLDHKVRKQRDTPYSIPVSTKRILPVSPSPVGYHQLSPGATVLDVGSGSGYLLAVMARMVQPGGRVYGVEHIPEVSEAHLVSRAAAVGAASDKCGR
jgi:SAM-dependent methyltransferase